MKCSFSVREVSRSSILDNLGSAPRGERMYKLEISLKRVQTYIFDVPRLKTMLGANAQVGQVMRHELAGMLNGRGKQMTWSFSQGESLPDDPLTGSTDPDDPKDAYEKGILARDGGHFIVVFETKENAEKFQAEAEARLAEKLPGVLYEITIKRWPETPVNGQAETGEDQTNDRAVVAQEIHLADLPVLQVCQETGREPASEQEEQEISEKNNQLQKQRLPWQARSVTQRKECGKQFYEGNTLDIIGLMGEALHPTTKTVGYKWQNPRDLQDLTAGGYLALIHADGNGIGMRYKRWRDGGKLLKAYEQEARGEAFYHGMRVVVRRAVVDALNETFHDLQDNACRPYQVLMLGGDDLLLACRADFALPFAECYAKELERHKLVDGRPLHVAIGVAIAQESYPLHRLYELAENLASSAKRLYRALKEEDRKSVIDWQVVTTSWFEGVAEARRQAELVEYVTGSSTENGSSTEKLVLTNRPVTAGNESQLSMILKNARDLDEPKLDAARSPLRALRAACERGRLSGEMAFARLPEEVRKLVGVPVDSGNAEADNKKPSYTLWKNEGSFHLTSALDIIGVREISLLGKKKRESK